MLGELMPGRTKVLKIVMGAVIIGLAYYAIAGIVLAIVLRR
jgi:hypothetical protein